MNAPSPETRGGFAKAGSPAVADAARPSAISEATVLRNSEDVAWRDVEGDMVVLDLNSGAYLTFNGLGRRVWLAAVAEKEVGAIVDDVVQEYEVERDQARADVCAFLTSLLQQGALIVASP
jgi:hypothetical protein